MRLHIMGPAAIRHVAGTLQRRTRIQRSSRHDMTFDSWRMAYDVVDDVASIWMACYSNTRVYNVMGDVAITRMTFDVVNEGLTCGG